MGERVEQLLAQMELEEKIALLAGADRWTTVAVERLGIPAIKVSDGPSGVRGAYGSMGPRSVCTPVGVALGATWNPELVQEVGALLGEETRRKGAHILLAPTVNIHRSPLAGRNFECYSEDPFLTGRLAVAYIKGIQSQGVGACIKHFVCNDSEFERRSISSEVGERPLREIYLAPFRMAVQEAKPWAVMSAYNKVNGTWASENPALLLGILKGEWDFDGIVISDWDGTYSPNAAAGGLDLEMPGPARWMGTCTLEAIEDGTVSIDLIDDKVRRLLSTIEKAGAFKRPELQSEGEEDRPEERDLMRQAAGEAIVLLKNEDVLPLELEQLDSIAVIGANARRAQIMGGGSSRVTPHYRISPLEGIRQRVGEVVEVRYSVGCANHRSIPLLDSAWLRTADGDQAGLTVDFFDRPEPAGVPVHRMTTDRTEINWSDNFVPNLATGTYSVRLSTILRVPETGNYTWSLASVGPSWLALGGAKLIDNWSDRPAEIGTMDLSEKSAEIELIGGRDYELTVEYQSRPTADWLPLQIRCMQEIPADSIDRAAALAARSDVAIVFAGLTNEWESEGFDRPDMDLRGKQAELIQRVATANAKTIVVLNTGAPVTMPWLERVPAVLQAWYGGQEMGNAIADVLFGDVNPSGKLPTSFPRHLQDNPAYLNYPGENGRVLYGEGLYVGYRYYEKKRIEPLFPFGHGLSYTTFAYRDLKLSADQIEPGEEIEVKVTVENTGPRAGMEVVQLYVTDLESTLGRPGKELKGFAKVAMEAGEKKTVSFVLGPEALSFYDPGRGGSVAEPGEFEVLVGTSSQDIRLTGRFWLGG